MSKGGGAGSALPAVPSLPEGSRRMVFSWTGKTGTEKKREAVFLFIDSSNLRKSREFPWKYSGPLGIRPIFWPGIPWFSILERLSDSDIFLIFLTIFPTQNKTECTACQEVFSFYLCIFHILAAFIRPNMIDKRSVCPYNCFIITGKYLQSPANSMFPDGM